MECPIDEFGCFLGVRYVLAGGCAVAWAPRGPKGAKKNLSAWPQNRGCGRLKKRTQIRLEGVKKYSSSVSHFFTGRLRVLHGGVAAHPSGPDLGRGPCDGRPSPICALGQGKCGLGPLPQSPLGPPPKPLAGCAGEPRRGRSWPGSHGHARAT